MDGCSIVIPLHGFSLSGLAQPRAGRMVREFTELRLIEPELARRRQSGPIDYEADKNQ